MTTPQMNTNSPTDVMKDPDEAVEGARRAEIERITANGTVRAAGVNVTAVDTAREPDGTFIPQGPVFYIEPDPDAAQSPTAWKNMGYPE